MVFVVCNKEWTLRVVVITAQICHLIEHVIWLSPKERSMKKIIMSLLGIGMCLFPTAGFAQGIESGDSLVSIYGGVGTALQKSGLNIDGKDLSWGNIGGELGLSYLYFPSAYFGIGADIHYAGFQGSTSVDYVPGYWYWHTFKSDFTMHSLHAMAIGRININPASRVRLYIPFGAGIAGSLANMEYTVDDYTVNNDLDYDASFSWYAGLGLEFELNNRTAWSLEARYSSFSYDYSGIADYHVSHVTGKRTENNYVSLVVSLKF